MEIEFANYKNIAESLTFISVKGKLPRIPTEIMIPTIIGIVGLILHNIGQTLINAGLVI